MLPGDGNGRELCVDDNIDNIVFGNFVVVVVDNIVFDNIVFDNFVFDNIVVVVVDNIVFDNIVFANFHVVVVVLVTAIISLCAPLFIQDMDRKLSERKISKYINNKNNSWPCTFSHSSNGWLCFGARHCAFQCASTWNADGEGVCPFDHKVHGRCNRE